MARAMGPLQDRHLSALNNSDMSSKLDEGRDDGNCINSCGAPPEKQAEP